MSTTHAFEEEDKSINAFEQQLALYRAKVYEMYMPLDRLDAQKTAVVDKRESPIWVIEDKPDDWLLMRWALRQTFPKTETVWLSDAVQVNTSVENYLSTKQLLPKLILLDLYLPNVKKGLRVLQFLKAHKRFQSIPVITVSRSTDANDIADAFKYASNLYLIKPPTYTEWVARIGELRKFVCC